MNKGRIISAESHQAMPDEYTSWRTSIEHRIEQAKLQAVLHVNKDMLSLYYDIGNDILKKQEEKGWGAQVIKQLAADLHHRFPDDRGLSERNLKYMRQFAKEYPNFPIVQVPLAQLRQKEIWQASLAKLADDRGFVQVPLAQITWYHHITLLAKVKDIAQRAFYILATARNGWSRDVMKLQIDNDYIHTMGHAINNFSTTLPPVESDLARDSFKDPYKFSFLGSEVLRNELDVERHLTARISDFLVEMGKGFAYVGRQYHLVVDGDDYYIDLLMYHLQLHCYVAIELKVVEFKPEFVSKLNFYISAIDEYIKTPNDAPTIGLLLCSSKSDTKAKLSLKGFTQPLGIASYEVKQKIADDVFSALPDVDDDEIKDNR